MEEKQDNLLSMSDPNLIVWRERLRTFFVEELHWKTHRIVDAELDKLGIALDVNENDKSEFSESDEKDEKVVVISISRYLFQEF